MNEFVVGLLSLIGIGSIFLVGLICGGMILIATIKKIWKFLFK